jgi:hypothetical protein
MTALMTTSGIGVFAYGAAIGWLCILFLVPPISSHWRALALAALLDVAAIGLCWWHGGARGAAVAALGVLAGALGATLVRFNQAVQH